MLGGRRLEKAAGVRMCDDGSSSRAVCVFVEFSVISESVVVGVCVRCRRVMAVAQCALGYMKE